MVGPISTDPGRPPQYANPPFRLGEWVWAVWLAQASSHPHLWHWCTEEFWVPPLLPSPDDDGDYWYASMGRHQRRRRSPWVYRRPEPGWRIYDTGAHVLVHRDPLELRGEVFWYCCGRHGRVTGGIWVPG